MIEKNTQFRSRAWLAAVRSLEYCVRCGAYGVEACHRNEGKGMGMKVSDALTWAGCRRCHVEIDQGKDMTREERRSESDRLIVKTIEQLSNKGLIGVVGDVHQRETFACKQAGGAKGAAEM